ncbi:MAG: hypothetical protein JWP89_4811 [Schlesneria sp.]|nr:hypothetical protein [Schlesneria sp.]
MGNRSVPLVATAGNTASFNRAGIAPRVNWTRNSTNDR